MPPVDLLRYADPEDRDERIETFLDIAWQDGPLGETEMNGVLPEDVLTIVRDRLDELNQGEFRCRENSLAITAIEEALGWLWQRRIKRFERDVLGTSQP